MKKLFKISAIVFIIVFTFVMLAPGPYYSSQTVRDVVFGAWGIASSLLPVIFIVMIVALIGTLLLSKKNMTTQGVGALDAKTSGEIFARTTCVVSLLATVLLLVYVFSNKEEIGLGVLVYLPLIAIGIIIFIISLTKYISCR